MGNLARTIAAVGALTGGYLGGRKMAEDREYERERRERERAEHEEKKALKDKIRAAGAIDVEEVAGGDEAAAAGKAALDQALAGARTDEERAQIQQDYAPTIQALEAQKASPAQFLLNGKTFSTRPTDEQIAGERRAATAAALGTVDPERAVNYEASALTLDEKRRGATYKAGWSERFKATPWGAAMAEGRAPSPGEQLQSSMDMLAYQAENGQASPEHMMAAAEKMKLLADEGYGKAMQALHAGASLDKVVQTFNAAGGQKIDLKSVTGYRPIEVDIGNGQKVKTHEIVYVDAAGNQRTFNGYRELDALGKAEGAFNRLMKLGDAARDERKIGIAEKAQNEARNDKKAAATAGVNLFSETNPGATPAQIEAVRHGVIPAVPKDDGYKTEFGEVSSALGTPAKDEQGKPITDTMTGRQVVNRNIAEEQKFFKWAREKGYKDTNKALAIYLAEKGAAPTIAADPRAAAIRDDPKLTREQKRSKLMELGYR